MFIDDTYNASNMVGAKIQTFADMIIKMVHQIITSNSSIETLTNNTQSRVSYCMSS